jgi:hypothetical protein
MNSTSNVQLYVTGLVYYSCLSKKPTPPALAFARKLSYHLAIRLIGTMLSGESEVPLPDTKLDT